MKHLNSLKKWKIHLDGTPCAGKLACTVRIGGKDGDNFKILPIGIANLCQEKIQINLAGLLDCGDKVAVVYDTYQIGGKLRKAIYG